MKAIKDIIKLSDYIPYRRSWTSDSTARQR